MLNIKDFLGKFNNITPPDNTIREYVSNLIYNILNIKIEKSDIKISNNSIYIKTNNIIKNEIFLNQQKILKNINNKFSKININNIF